MKKHIRIEHELGDFAELTWEDGVVTPGESSEAFRSAVERWARLPITRWGHGATDAYVYLDSPGFFVALKQSLETQFSTVRCTITTIDNNRVDHA